MRKMLWVAAVVLGVAFSGTAMAADGAKIFLTKCSPCHGPKGEGTALAPPFKDNAFIKDSDTAVLKEIVDNGRAGSAKKYPKFPIDMPKQGLSAGDAEAVIAYIKSL